MKEEFYVDEQKLDKAKSDLVETINSFKESLKKEKTTHQAFASLMKIDLYQLRKFFSKTSFDDLNEQEKIILEKIIEWPESNNQKFNETLRNLKIFLKKQKLTHKRFATEILEIDLYQWNKLLSKTYQTLNKEQRVLYLKITEWLDKNNLSTFDVSSKDSLEDMIELVNSKDPAISPNDSDSEYLDIIQISTKIQFLLKKNKINIQIFAQKILHLSKRSFFLLMERKSFLDLNEIDKQFFHTLKSWIPILEDWSKSSQSLQNDLSASESSNPDVIDSKKIVDQFKDLLKKQKITIENFANKILNMSRESFYYFAKKDYSKLDEIDKKNFQTVQKWTEIMNGTVEISDSNQQILKELKDYAYKYEKVNRSSSQIEISETFKNLKSILTKQKITQLTFSVSILNVKVYTLQRLMGKKYFDHLDSKEKVLFEKITRWLEENKDNSIAQYPSRSKKKTKSLDTHLKQSDSQLKNVTSLNIKKKYKRLACKRLRFSQEKRKSAIKKLLGAKKTSPVSNLKSVFNLYSLFFVTFFNCLLFF